MSDFIEEFYYGNIEPQESTTELKPKVMKCLNELAQKEKHLFDTLNDEDKELFTDYVDTYIRFLSICNADSFIAGFRLGARFAYDTFVERKDN
jgi:hypothetical protein